MNERRAKKQLETTVEFKMGVRRGRMTAGALLDAKGFRHGKAFNFEVDDFIQEAHLPKYAPIIPVTIKTEGQHERYGMGFDYGLARYLEDIHWVANSHCWPEKCCHATRGEGCKLGLWPEHVNCIFNTEAVS